MDIAEHSVGPVVVATLQGDLDGLSADTTRERLVPLLTSNGRVVVDLTAVPYMSSAGLRMMLLLHRQAQRMDCHVALVGLSEELRAVMAATGFLEFFLIDESVEACTTALLELTGDRANEPV
jgi:anti-sigma B factor antagonist